MSVWRAAAWLDVASGIGFELETTWRGDSGLCGEVGNDTGVELVVACCGLVNLGAIFDARGPDLLKFVLMGAFVLGFNTGLVLNVYAGGW